MAGTLVDHQMLSVHNMMSKAVSVVTLDGGMDRILLIETIQLIFTKYMSLGFSLIENTCHHIFLVLEFPPPTPIVC